MESSYIEGRKSILDLINDCDRIPPNANTASFYRFQLASHPHIAFGLIPPSTIDSFRPFLHPPAWIINDNLQTLTLTASSLEARNEQVQAALLAAQQRNSFSNLHRWSPTDTETFPVFSYGKPREHVLDVPRAAAPLFGIVGRGVQLFVYREATDGLQMWVAKRSMQKRGFPGMWDATVGGALGTGEGVLEGLTREAEEEARLDKKLVRERARACGTVCYVYVTDDRSGGEAGLVCPEVQFVYDLCVRDETVPVSGDGEVEEFALVGMEELRARLERGEFRPASACVIIDFLVRHGILTAENEIDYEEITQRIHRFIDLKL